MTVISAEFESPELAELALGRIKSTVSGVHSVRLNYNRISDRAERLRGGEHYTIIPVISTVHSYNFFTAVLEQPASEGVIPEPSRSRSARLSLICEDSGAAQIKSLLHALGAYNVYEKK